MARWKARVELLSRVIELLFLSLTVEVLQGKMCQNSLLSGRGRSLAAYISGGGVVRREYFLVSTKLDTFCYRRQLAIQVQLSFRTEFLNLAVPLTVTESVGYKYLLSKWLKSVSRCKTILTLMLQINNRQITTRVHLNLSNSYLSKRHVKNSNITWPQNIANSRAYW